MVISVEYCRRIGMKKIIHIALACGLCLFGAIRLQAQEKETMVLIDTDKGKITVRLYNETPQHRDNFIKLVNEHQYNGLLFHRVIK